jgi:hypothetical protein
MTDRLDDLLRRAGRSFADSPPAGGPDAGDVARRTRARAQRQRLAAAALAAVVVLVGALTLRPGPGDQALEIEAGGTAAPTTAPPAPSALTGPPDRTAAPTLPVPGPMVPAVTDLLRPTTTVALTPTSPPPAGPLRWFDPSFGFPGDSCPSGPVGNAYTVVGPDEPITDGSVRVVDVQYGDAVPGGSEEALVRIRCPGARGVETAWLFTRTGPAGRERLVEALPDRWALDRLRADHGIEGVAFHRADLVDGDIRAEASGYTGTDAGCCPSFTVRYRVSTAQDQVPGWATMIDEVTPR